MPDITSRPSPATTTPATTTPATTTPATTTPATSMTRHPASAPAPAATETFDLPSVLVVAVLAAVVVMAFWKVIVKLVVVGGLALVFAGFLVPLWMIARR